MTLAVSAVAGCAGTTPDVGAEFDKTHPPVPFSVTEGTAFDLGEGQDTVRLTVMHISEFDQTPEHFPRLRIAMRSENTSDRTLNNPDLQLHCDESPVGGEWYGGSTWEIDAILKSGETREGEVYIGFPPKTDRSQYAVASCTNAYIAITGTRWNDRQTFEARITVPPEVIQAAIDAPIGEHLPRPRPQN